MRWSSTLLRLSRIHLVQPGGAVRSFAAAFHAVTLAPDEFRRWSLEVFLGLLAWDWLRILIWFDHMGLRVATLVNLSFVGGDLLDEKSARFIGHPLRTRSMPEGVRRFATWGPLLIPFYIPRGVEWDYAWTGAEAVRSAQAALSPPVAGVLGAYLFTGAVAALAVPLLWLHERRRRPRRPARAERSFVLANGSYALELSPQGRGFSRVISRIGGETPLDLTRRPDDPLQDRGKFFLLREPGPAGGAAGAWSLGARPLGRVGADYVITRQGPGALRIEQPRRRAPRRARSTP
jgi:cyclic beta-1,2-glucan synthetase